MPKTMGEKLDRETLRWLKWFTRPTRISCEYCIPYHAEVLLRLPDCKKCGLPQAFLLDKYFNKEKDYEKDKQKTTTR